MSENIIEGIQREVARNRELLKEYEAIGPVGTFGATMIKQNIIDAKSAVAHGDTIEMIRQFQSLKENK